MCLMCLGSAALMSFVIHSTSSRTRQILCIPIKIPSTFHNQLAGPDPAAMMRLISIVSLARITRTTSSSTLAHPLGSPVGGRDGSGRVLFLLVRICCFVNVNVLTEREWQYQHPTLIQQLNQGWRTLELDFHFRDKSILFYHHQMWDQLSHCVCYYQCLG